METVDESLAVVKSGTEALDEFSNKIQETRSDLEQYNDTIDDINYIRWAVCVGFGLFIIILISLYFLGVLFGITCGYSKDPTKRSCISHFGSRLMQISNICFWIISVFMMLFCMTFYLLGGAGQAYFCEPLQGPDYELLVFAEGFVNNYTDGEISIQKSLEATGLTWEPEEITADITITSILKDCSKNEPLYKIVLLDHVPVVTNALTLIIDDSKELSEKILTFIDEDVEDLIQQGIDDTELEGLVDDTLAYIKDFVSALNLLLGYLEKTYDSIVAQGVDGLTTSTATWIEDLTQLLEEDLPIEVKTTVNIAITNLTNIYENEEPNFQNQFESWEKSLGNIESKSTTLINNLDLISTKLNDTETFVSQDLSKIAAVRIYDGTEYLLNSIVDFSNFIVETTTLELGNCENIYKIYQQTDTILCSNIMDTVNGFWFCLGWLCASIPFMIFFGLKSGKYFKTYSITDDYDELSNYSQ